MRDYVMNIVPVKRRARFNRHTGNAYTPEKTEREEKAVASAYKGEKFGGAVRLDIHVHRRLPSDRPKSVKKEADTYSPDLDNIVKAIMDGLNGVAYDDDRQVVEIHAYKHPRIRKPGDSVRFQVSEVEI